MGRILRGLAGEGDLRVVAAETTDVVEEARLRHGLSPTATAALGRAMTGALLLAQLLLKTPKERITLRVEGTGPLGGLVVEADAFGHVRGYVKNPRAEVPLREDGKLNVGELVGAGALRVDRSLPSGEVYTSTVPLVSGEIAEDLAHYLHLPPLTDPSLAPPGHHAAYTLVPVPHNGSGLDWGRLGPEYLEKALRYLDEAGYLPGLMDRLVYTHFITPDYFQWTLNSHLGNAFGPEPVLWQTASFRPKNRSEDVKGLYLVGQSYQPGAGLPSVMMSAKITARLIAHDLGLEKAPKGLLEARG